MTLQEVADELRDMLNSIVESRETHGLFGAEAYAILAREEAAIRTIFIELKKHHPSLRIGAAEKKKAQHCTKASL